MLRKTQKPFGGGSVNGFIVKKATKGFVEGDMLKAAGYNAPATNFARGNVFEDAHNGTIVPLDRNCLMEKQEFIAKAKEFVQRHIMDKSLNIRACLIQLIQKK